MRFVLISDSHTKENIERIYRYMRKKSPSWKIHAIIINGDILGEDEAREGYGYNYNKTLFHASLEKKRILESVAPGLDFTPMVHYFESGKKDQQQEIEHAKLIKQYMEMRYDFVLQKLKDFSEIKKTYYNMGTYESPLHYKVLKELSFLLDVPESFIRSTALLTDYRTVFKEFRKKLNALDNVHYVGGSTSIQGNILIAGIPGLHHNPVATDKLSEFQEKMTAEMIDTVKRRLSYAKKLLLLNPVQGRLRKNPFAFRPASRSVREFIESLRGKLSQKVYVQSYHHFMTTHFYQARDFHFILNNSGVNNALFNIVDMGKKVKCYDVDPNKEHIRKLFGYNYNLADYATAKERLALNYENAEEVIKQRNLQGCYYL